MYKVEFYSEQAQMLLGEVECGQAELIVQVYKGDTLSAATQEITELNGGAFTIASSTRASEYDMFEEVEAYAVKLTWKQAQQASVGVIERLMNWCK